MEQKQSTGDEHNAALDAIEFDWVPTGREISSEIFADEAIGYANSYEHLDKDDSSSHEQQWPANR